jgi:DNA-binding NtrC family response regulator/pSer/pThr/pTyr-binding forkhead associated (FHA) protein
MFHSWMGEVSTGTTPAERTLHSADDGATAAVGRRHLLVFSGPSSWMYQLPASGRVVIGRAETADLRIDDASISRQHAAAEIDADGVTISDLGSQNGTYVNEQRISGVHVLHANDVITIHKTTLILHATSPATVAAVVLDHDALRKRIEDESDRAVRYERKFSVLSLVWPAPVPDRRRTEQQIAGQLRRIDAAAWSIDEHTFEVMLAEASQDEAIAIASRLRAKLREPSLRIGHATCPDDGYEADALLASAHNAAVSVGASGIGGAQRSFQTLTIGPQRVIVADPAVARLYALIERLAPVDLPVLVTGETGCGKELAATAIHLMSRRRNKQMVSLNCAAIQDTLVESELFGHEKGAFSGAVAAKAGLIEAATGSTLFLDEVGELALSAQAKLLRVLETQRVTRVGDVREREVDVRIVAATHRDLEAQISDGKFRQDLYFRLSGATLHLPPLRERPRELPLLAAAFLDDACRKSGRGMMALSDAALVSLAAYPWPGNVRELKNLMQYIAAAHPESIVTADHVGERLDRAARAAASKPASDPPSPRAAPGEFRPLADEVRELEIRRIREAIEATSGNQTRAASLLAMPVRTFFEKAKQYGLTPKKKA